MNHQANVLVQTLRKKKLTLAMAESMTCGLAAHRLSGCIGTSEVFKGSIVCYTAEVKTNLLKIQKKKIEKFTCESKQVTTALAKNMSKLIKADVYAAITGLASPGGSETKKKPVGTVFFCVRYNNKIINVRKKFKGQPLDIRKKACSALYKIIIDRIKKES